MTAKQNNKNKKKKSIVIVICDIHIFISFNNIIVCVTATDGRVVAWSSGGKMGFKGTRCSTPHAAKLTVEDAIKQAFVKSPEIKSIRSIIVKGICPSRDAAVREVMQIATMRNMPPIEYVKDITPVAHNGCKPPKRRRV